MPPLQPGRCVYRGRLSARRRTYRRFRSIYSTCAWSLPSHSAYEPVFSPCGGAAQLFLGGERLQDLLRDIDARAAVDGFLQDKVEFFRFGNLPDDLVGA